MKIAVFGLGYVGCVSLGCLANNGHSVIGVDVSDFKVDLINSGKPTIVEKDIDELISKYRKAGSIKATTDHTSAVKGSEVAFICVGTPSLPTGQLNLTHVYQIAEQIGKGLKEKDSFYTIVIRSTVMPGTNEKVGNIIEQFSGKNRNSHFAVVSNPEFLREGSAVNDYYNPSMTVIGTENQSAFELLQKIYSQVKAPVIKTDIGVAEMIKYVNNSFHALKITFANEVGVIAKTLGTNSRDLMELFVLDNKLNISPAYFKPGMGYGGSCLPKDLKGLNAIAYDNYLNTPLLKGIDESNIVHNNRAFELVEKFQSKRVGIIGLAFKKGTDDLRYSPAVNLAEKLAGKGYDVKIYDKNVVLSKLLGANKSYIEEKLPHISAMLVNSIEEVVRHAQTLVLVHRLDEVIEHKDKLRNKNIVDLAGYEEFREFKNYSGIAW
jgi:GDP-mannose 6-dehydrogenase